MAACTFRNCKSDWAFIKSLVSELLITYGVFESLAAVKYPLVSVESSNPRIEIRHTEFKQVSFDSSVAAREIIEVVNGGTSVTLENVTVTGLVSKHLLNCSLSEALSVGHYSVFTDCQVEQLFKVDGECVLSQSIFTNCRGQLIQMSNADKDLTLATCIFQNCWSSTSFIEITSVKTFYLQECCFQNGEATGLNIKGPANTNLLPDDRLCFDRTRDQAVDFGGANPFAEIEKVRTVFGCTSCEAVPTPEPTPIPPTPSSPSDDPTNTDPIQPTGGESGSKQGGLSAGGIVGILIAILICLALLILIIILVLRRRRMENSSERDQGDGTEETIDDTMSSGGNYETATAEVTEDNPLFSQQLVFPETQNQQFEEQ